MRASFHHWGKPSWFPLHVAETVASRGKEAKHSCGCLLASLGPCSPSQCFVQTCVASMRVSLVCEFVRLLKPSPREDPMAAPKLTLLLDAIGPQG
eukprot:CAMPEP_0172677396 /NCGR_PEP_ID=MMETSP1074-20121228/14646_1 /TAXON_ID=2916 /ORGANISM="Ceratium fusus, Strain PA161109" /LENGTH=94 /DNA_ID=CAMNT_0013495223 /DNA_START=99 /DNA_END=379 /DNA_ORIENTATION=-